MTVWVPRVILAEARPVRRQRLARRLAATPGLSLVCSCASLMEAYTRVEVEVPDAVLTSAPLRALPEHAMFAELTRLLGVTGLVLDDGGEDRALAALRSMRPTAGGRETPPLPAAAPDGYDGPVILIGASTGGVEALHRLIGALPVVAPPVLIVQHIRGAFSGAFARRLDRQAAGTVTEAADGLPLAPGRIYVAPGDSRHLTLAASGPAACHLAGGDPVNGHRPSVDILFRSALPMAARTVAVLLTGMGQDGARGLLDLRRAGAVTIAQDRASSTVWGMPRVAVELGAAASVLPLDDIGRAALAAAASDGVH